MARINWCMVFTLAAVIGLGRSQRQNMALAEESAAAQSSGTGGFAMVEESATDSAADSGFKLTSMAENVSDACKLPGCNESCGESCGGACGSRRWVVEAEAVFLAPIQHQEFGMVGFLDRQFEYLETYSTDNPSDFTLTPRIALGVQGECWGLMARYWRLQAGDMQTDYAAITGNGLTAENCLRAETADLEVTRLIGLGEGCTQLRASFGARYAQLREVADLKLDYTEGLTYYESEVLASHQFSGAGLTAGLTGLRPIGCNGFNLFFGARASMLWDGDAQNLVATRADYFEGVSAASHSDDAAISEGPGNLFIGELQIGGQWNVPLKCVPANAFLRVVAEYQYWCTGNDGFAEAGSWAGPTGSPYVFAAGESRGNSHVDFFGLGIGTGLTY